MYCGFAVLRCLECRRWANGLRGELRDSEGAVALGHLRGRAEMGSLELQAQVAQAVHILNHDTQSVNRVAANQWLVRFQNTDAAWEVATTILALDSSPTIDFEVELFAGQVLKRKVRFWVFTFSLLSCLKPTRKDVQHIHGLCNRASSPKTPRFLQTCF